MQQSVTGMCLGPRCSATFYTLPNQIHGQSCVALTEEEGQGAEVGGQLSWGAPESGDKPPTVEFVVLDELLDAGETMLL